MDVEKTIEFLQGNQANFDARIAQLDTRIARLVEVQVQLADVQSHDNDMIVALTGAVRELSDAQKRGDAALTQERQRAQAAEQELREHLARVSDNVASLVRMFHEWIRGNGGGGPRPA